MSEETFPDRLRIRDTRLHDDMGGAGQRIYTTAGQGYTKVEYVRADLHAALRAEVERLHDVAEHWREQFTYQKSEWTAAAMLIDDLRSQLSARDAEVRALQFDQRDLVALVGRLCRALPQDDDRRIQAMGYLTRKNLLGSVLRALTCEPGPGGEG